MLNCVAPCRWAPNSCIFVSLTIQVRSCSEQTWTLHFVHFTVCRRIPTTGGQIRFRGPLNQVVPCNCQQIFSSTCDAMLCIIVQQYARIRWVLVLMKRRQMIVSCQHSPFTLGTFFALQLYKCIYIYLYIIYYILYIIYYIFYIIHYILYDPVSSCRTSLSK